MENMDLQSNLSMMENVEFEEKVDIKIESDHDVGKEFKLKIEENILRMYQELDKEKSENSTIDFSLRRSLKIRKFVEKMTEHDNVDHQMISEIVSLKAKIVEVTEKHESTMLLNAKTMNSIVKMHEKAQEALEDKSNELANIKQELQSVKVTNQELLQKLQELEINKKTLDKKDSLERHNEIHPFSCKHCEKSFLQVHEVKEHIKVHASILRANDETTILTYGKDSFTNENQNKVKITPENLKVKNDFHTNLSPDLVNSVEIPPKRKILKKPCSYICDICEKSYSTSNILLRHKKIHLGIKTVMCRLEGCGKSFFRKDELKQHNSLKHSKKTEFMCPNCKIGYKVKISLTRHLKTNSCGMQEFTKNNKRKSPGKSSKSIKDTAKKQNVKETFDESDDNEEDWENDLEEEFETRKEREGLLLFKERRKKIKKA